MRKSTKKLIITNHNIKKIVESSIKEFTRHPGPPSINPILKLPKGVRMKVLNKEFAIYYFYNKRKAFILPNPLDAKTCFNLLDILCKYL